MVSVAIHIIGALAFYFYYNPISELSLSKKDSLSDSLDSQTQLNAEEALPAPPVHIEESPESLAQEDPATEAQSPPSTTIFSKLKKFFKKEISPEPFIEPESSPETSTQTSPAPKPAIKPVSESLPEPPSDLRLEAKPETSPDSLQSSPKIPAQKPEELNSQGQTENSMDISSSPSKETGLSDRDPPQKTFSDSLQTGLELSPTPQEDLELQEMRATSKKALPQKEEVLEESLAKEVQKSSSQKLKNTDLENKKLKAKESVKQSQKARFKKLSELRQKPGNPILDYPDFARRKGQQGELSVIFYVNAEGLTEQIQLELSSGHAELDNFVLRHLSKYKFLDQNLWVRFKRKFVLKGEEVESLKLRTLDNDEKAL